MFSQNNLCVLNNNVSSGVAIIYLNIYIYIFILYLFFCLLFLYDIKKIKTLSDLKIFNKYNFVCISTVLVILSLAGIPPLMGFVGKFLLFIFLFFSQKYNYIILFSLLNFFSIYFYTQNLRFLISKTQGNFFLVDGFYIFFNVGLINIIVILNLFNFFGILFAEDLYYYLLNVIFFKNN